MQAVRFLRPDDRDRDPAGPIPCPGIVGHINDRETAEMLLGLDERPVGEYRRAAGRVDAAQGGRRVEAAVAEDEDTGDPSSPRSRLHLGRRAPLAHHSSSVRSGTLVVEGDQVRLVDSCSRAAQTTAAHLLHERTRVDSAPPSRLVLSLPHRSRSHATELAARRTLACMPVG